MADLSDIQAAQPVKLVGASSTGVESNPVGADADLALQTRAVGSAVGTPTRPAVTSASSTILAANSKRLFGYVRNNSGVQVFLQFGAAAVLNQGHPLPSGATFFFYENWKWTGSVTAIKSGAGSINLEVFEAVGT